jgi:hypothetical protein
VLVRDFLCEHGLDAFTYNAFPYDGFDRDGLKEHVFEPTWWERTRMEYTLDVARVAAALQGNATEGRHLSISTHTGAHSSQVPAANVADTRAKCFFAWSRAGEQLTRIQGQLGWLVLLALEPEPGALIASQSELLSVATLVRGGAGAFPAPIWPSLERHVGTCLDTCHAAVEFEDDAEALSSATLFGAGIGKIQFTSALALLDPAHDDAGREALFALQEPRYLHQVNGRVGAALCRAGDLPEARRAYDEGEPGWRDCGEWRCHYHVPVDLEDIPSKGLTTTRTFADSILRSALATPLAWRRRELHVEIETYTWDVLPHEARGAGELVDGLEREYRHVIGLLEREGWRA